MLVSLNLGKAFAASLTYLLLVSIKISKASDVQVVTSTRSESPRATVVPKTVTSDKLRLVFFAGIEGTGHHFATGAFRLMYSNHDDLEQPESCLIGPSLYFPFTMSRSSTHYAKARDTLRLELQKLSIMEKDVHGPGAIVTVQRTSPMQEAMCFSYGELSYPNSNGPDKVLAYPDLQMLAEMAEEEGIDFRIVYLQRPAKDLLLSNVSHRHFHHHLIGIHINDSRPDELKFLRYVQVLLVDLAALHSSLAEIDPKFVVCHYYEDMAEDEQATRVANFVAPNSHVAGYLRESLTRSARKRNKQAEQFDYNNADHVITRVQRKLNVLESQFCGPRNQ